MSSLNWMIQKLHDNGKIGFWKTYQTKLTTQNKIYHAKDFGLNSADLCKENKWYGLNDKSRYISVHLNLIKLQCQIRKIHPLAVYFHLNKEIEKRATCCASRVSTNQPSYLKPPRAVVCFRHSSPSWMVRTPHKRRNARPEALRCRAVVSLSAAQKLVALRKEGSHYPENTKSTRLIIHWKSWICAGWCTVISPWSNGPRCCRMSLSEGGADLCNDCRSHLDATSTSILPHSAVVAEIPASYHCYALLPLPSGD